MDLDSCHASAAMEASHLQAEGDGADHYRYLWDSEAAVLTAAGQAEDLRPCFYCGSDQS